MKKSQLPSKGKITIKFVRTQPDFDADEEALVIWLFKVLREFGLTAEIEGTYDDYEDSILNDI